MRLNGIVGAEIPYYKMMNKAMPGPAKDTKRKPKNGRLNKPCKRIKADDRYCRV